MYSTSPGASAGRMSFHADVLNAIVIRRNESHSASGVHEDLMVIYLQPGESARRRAIYFDNENHVIEYTADFSAERRTFTFLSEAAPSAPRQRLTYTREGTDRVSIKFEIAPPDKPEAFSTNVEGSAHRKN